MMEEADEQPEVLHPEDPNIASQLQEAAQTDVTAGNGSPKKSAGGSPQKSFTPSVPAPSPLPALSGLGTPRLDIPGLVTPRLGTPGVSATIPVTSSSASSPLPNITPTKTTHLLPSQNQSPGPSITGQSIMFTPAMPLPVTTAPSSITAPGVMQTPHEASSTIDISSVHSDVQPASPGVEGRGLFGWGRGIMSKMVEKTKSSVESVITTLDPGMKQVIHTGGDMDVVVTSTKEAKVSPIREAFQQVFGKATITGQESQANTAAQPVGYTAGLKGAEERIQNLRHSGSIHEKQPVISVEGFIAELLPDRWYELSCLVLQDPGNRIEIQTFSQATLVPAEIVQRMQDGTAADYPLSWSGLAVTVGEAVEQTMPHVSRTNWHQALSGIKRRDSLFLAANGLAEMYRQRLPAENSL